MNKISTELRLEALKQQIEKGIINRFLYKYKPDNKFTRKIVTENTIWFAQPSSFNDVYDCKANSQFQQKDLEQWFSIKTGRSTCCSKNIIATANGKKNLLKAIQNDINKVLDKIGVLCLSKTPFDILMWAYYADSSKGICFEFDVLEDHELFSPILPVIYSEELPIYNHFVNNDRIVTDVILTKAKCWEHEEEVRVLKSGDEIRENKSQAFKFNPNALTKIIFGPKTPDDVVNQYKDLCGKRNDFCHVKFSRIVKCQDRYSFVEKEIQ